MGDRTATGWDVGEMGVSAVQSNRCPGQTRTPKERLRKRGGGGGKKCGETKGNYGQQPRPPWPCVTFTLLVVVSTSQPS